MPFSFQGQSIDDDDDDEDPEARIYNTTLQQGHRRCSVLSRLSRQLHYRTNYNTTLMMMMTTPALAGEEGNNTLNPGPNGK